MRVLASGRCARLCAYPRAARRRPHHLRPLPPPSRPLKSPRPCDRGSERAPTAPPPPSPSRPRAACPTLVRQPPGHVDVTAHAPSELAMSASVSVSVSASCMVRSRLQSRTVAVANDASLSRPCVGDRVESVRACEPRGEVRHRSSANDPKSARLGPCARPEIARACIDSGVTFGARTADEAHRPPDQGPPKMPPPRNSLLQSSPGPPHAASTEPIEAHPLRSTSRTSTLPAPNVFSRNSMVALALCNARVHHPRTGCKPSRPVTGERKPPRPIASHTVRCEA
ncbi:hypothetical protein C8Q78DRAFT_324280 [Trametes maxima]|nr:hypothetical protein C8Q78DRAFT_324280 [Trametes maxima]